MRQTFRRLTVRSDGGGGLPGLRALLQVLVHCKPRPIAAFAAALAMSLAVLTGAFDSLERRLSDAWFGLTNATPSGHVVLVTFDPLAGPSGEGMRVSRRDLAELLLRLDEAGAARILVEVGLAERTNAPDDAVLERVLAKLGGKIGVAATAVVTANQTGWRRTAALERFARHVARTASDLGLDKDGVIRRSGIEDSGLPNLTSDAAWLNGAMPDHGGSSDGFRIDFGIDLNRIPLVEAASVVRGQTAGLAGASVIVAGHAPAAGKGLAVPRYSEVTRPQVTALAAETLALGRSLHGVPFALSAVGLVALAGLIAFWCVPRKAIAAAGLCGLVALGGMGFGAALQVFAGVVAPAVGIAVAAVLGYAAAQVMVHPAFQRLRQGAVTVLADIDVELLSRIATQDALTGVANRRAFEEALRRACTGSERQFALLLCDLDGFKQVNDTMGHKAGDGLLREISARLVAETGPGGLVARLGGDEFAILLSNATQPLAAQAARRLVGAVAHPIELGGRSAAVGVSIGIALGTQPGDEHALLESADAAMYAAKRGRTGYGFGREQEKAVTAASEPPAADLRETGRLYARAG